VEVFSSIEEWRGIMMESILKNIDVTKPLKEQKKPDFVCEPGDPRVKKFGWTKSKFKGYISIDDCGNTIWISAVMSKQPGKGNYSRLIKNLRKAGFTIKVPSPMPRMEEICKHMGFTKTVEHFPEAGEDIDVWVMEP
jgi:hypothetical protein